MSLPNDNDYEEKNKMSYEDKKKVNRETLLCVLLFISGPLIFFLLLLIKIKYNVDLSDIAIKLSSILFSTPILAFSFLIALCSNYPSHIPSKIVLTIFIIIFAIVIGFLAWFFYICCGSCANLSWQ